MTQVLDRRAEQQGAVAEASMRSVFDSLDGHIAVIDPAGRIVAANAAWREYGAARAGVWRETGVGANYLDVCRRSAAGGDEAAGEALAGIEAVLSGSRASFASEYLCPSRDRDSWFRMTVQPWRRPEGGAIVSHMDITARRQVELERERLREELFHIGRVSVAGELAASLGHEMSQPLVAILTNAQAALRWDIGHSAESAPLRKIVSDIETDARRAVQLIERLRALFRKGGLRPEALDMNSLIADTVALAKGQIERRRAKVTLELAPDLPELHADRIHLQQVLLNLIVNALDAMDAAQPENRLVIVRTAAVAGPAVQVSVEDRGAGLPEQDKERVFRPFHTTKAHGMGMGLSICRSIVQAHRGRIWAANNERGGATFSFVIPVSSGA
jgi:C4-dicarboxylate-specific signal transduction histidine kinase